MHQIWPTEDARPLDDDALERLYTYPLRPRWLAVNFVASADGAVEVGGLARPLSTPPDRKVLQLGSDLADVLLIGATTAMVEGFRGVHPDRHTLTRRRRHGLADTAPTAVVTTGRTLPPDAPVITRARVPTIVLTCASAPAPTRRAWQDAGAEVVVAGEDAVDLAAAVAALTRRGLRRIDCEGGPHLFGALAAAGQVDELRLTVSPLLTAGPAGRIATGPPGRPTDLRLASAIAEEDTLLLRYLTRPAGRPGRQRAVDDDGDA
ncbi:MULTISPECIES: dihydrofolate reductase family protein [unclassified Streptomyces]|uniref:dihydrofolate reductase family protein n=1 Tax=unclassified Streptomyces TaxID=2593676 RepID=UPI0033CB8251|nr:dihydrofolate reductase family protein [Streptomyces sp. NBC_01124]